MHSSPDKLQLLTLLVQHFLLTFPAAVMSLKIQLQRYHHATLAFPCYSCSTLLVNQTAAQSDFRSGQEDPSALYLAAALPFRQVGCELHLHRGRGRGRDIRIGKNGVCNVICAVSRIHEMTSPLPDGNCCLFVGESTPGFLPPGRVTPRSDGSNHPDGSKGTQQTPNNGKNSSSLTIKTKRLKGFSALKS